MVTAASEANGKWKCDENMGSDSAACEKSVCISLPDMEMCWSWNDCQVTESDILNQRDAGERDHLNVKCKFQCRHCCPTRYKCAVELA